MFAEQSYFIGCDVGTGSVRAGLFDRLGRMLSMQTREISMWRPRTDFVQQSSDNVWEACCHSIRNAVEEAQVEPRLVKGIGFDATCSLVVLDEDDQPLTVSTDGADEQNIIVWMDHRATKEAEEINSTEHEVLKYVGGTISPEMQSPKLLWLKRNLPETWKKAGKFFDLSDFLVYRATGVDVRSVCTTTCKWTYLAHEQSESGEDAEGWDESFFKEIGLGDLADEEFRRIGRRIRPVGESAGDGLTQRAAEEFGLSTDTAVGVAIIDAHAGGLGLLGMSPEGTSEQSFDPERRLALIAGTSNCHMAVSREAKFIDGVWGPYYSAMIPELWLNEGGQSAAGALIDHIIFSSKHSGELEKQAEKEDKTVYEVLNERLYRLADEKDVSDVGELTRDLHVLPYFHGNRSPRADPSLLGGIFGLKLSDTPDDLALQYLATIQSLAYGTRHIIETMDEKGYKIQNIMATGGLVKNELFLKEHADICGCKIVLPEETEAVLLGGAVLGAVASGLYPGVLEAMQHMNNAGRSIHPEEKTESYHEAKYRVFHKMYEDEISYFDIMDSKSD